MLAVFVERCRSHAVQFAAGQSWFQQIGCVHGAFARPGSDDGVQLVDKQNHLAVGIGYFFQDGFQAVFKLAAILGSGNQCSHVESDDRFVFQILRNVAHDDAMSESLDNRRLADTGFADQYRVVLAASREHLNDAADFGVPTDNRVDFSLAGLFDQIDAVLFQSLVFFFG